ncbi:hypothetical protein ASN18_1323 [Candidatus Magnetominusculus xianensis]|uniref:Uncharacterized protein n=1 Tax=Candidatus Magnetominusculus xianensis TaxID=1748249 RepID=A0ABR5SHD4_9BACT|nr:hypothetical protein ASN18_1323 [Candidatus Magnetominusculus xianensis]
MICDFCNTLKGCQFAFDAWELNHKYDSTHRNQKANISVHLCVQQRDINSALSRNVKLFATALLAGLVSFFLARHGSRVNDKVNDDSWLDM